MYVKVMCVMYMHMAYGNECKYDIRMPITDLAITFRNECKKMMEVEKFKAINPA